MKKRQKNKIARPQKSNWRCRRNSIIIGGAVALAAVLLSAYFIDNNSQDRARILRVKGSVRIERAGGTVNPVAGAVLNPEDKIITAAGSFAEVTYDDTHKDVLRIGADSSVVLESAGIEKQTNIFMSKGDIMVKLENLQKGSTFKIRTPTAVAGVRGTSFAVRLIEEGKEALITDFESRIFVKGLTEDFLEMKDELLLSEGWKVRVAQFEKPSRVEKVSPQELTQWQAWLDEINSLPQYSPAQGQGFTAEAPYRSALSEWRFTQASGLLGNVATSAPILAFLLYVALAVNIGRLFQWQVNMNRASI